MIHYKTLDEIQKIQDSCLLVSKTLSEVTRMLKDGMTTLAIDTMIETFINDHNAKPAFKGYHGYPFASCISVNDTVVHGFPNNNALQIGDIVSIDIGVFKNGYHGDSAYSFIIGDADEKKKHLLVRTKQALLKGIQEAKVGKRLEDISYAIQDATEGAYRYGVVRDLVGHGIGRELHESPSVPNYGKKGRGVLLKNGLVIAIEPMINLGHKDVYTAADGWTIKTKDRSVSAHFEHTIAVTQNGPQILSDFGIIEAEIAQNKNLWNEVI